MLTQKISLISQSKQRNFMKKHCLTKEQLFLNF